MGKTPSGDWAYWTGTQQDLEPLTLPGDMLVCTGGAGLNVRSDPSATATLIQTLTDETVVRGEQFVLTEPGTFLGSGGNGWYRISAPTSGWVYSPYVFAHYILNTQMPVDCTGLPLATSAPAAASPH
jgi:hypothetical protein